MQSHAFQPQGLVSFTLAITPLFAGKSLVQRYELLCRYSIPEPASSSPPSTQYCSSPTAT